MFAEILMLNFVIVKYFWMEAGMKIDKVLGAHFKDKIERIWDKIERKLREFKTKLREFETKLRNFKTKLRNFEIKLRKIEKIINQHTQNESILSIKSPKKKKEKFLSFLSFSSHIYFQKKDPKNIRRKKNFISMHPKRLFDVAFYKRKWTIC